MGLTQDEKGNFTLTPDTEATLPDGRVVVPLCALDPESLVGRRVFHPPCQIGDIPYWTNDNCPRPYFMEEEDDPWNEWDEGVVVEVFKDKNPNFPDRALFECTDEDGDKYTLHYTLWNLWTEKA